MVKKYILLFTFTAAIIAIMFNLSAIMFYNIPFVMTTSMTPNIYEQKVFASGKIEEISKKDVSYSIPIVTQAVYIEEGSEIDVGDVIAKVDVIKTKDALMDLINLTDIIPKEYESMLDEIDVELDIEQMSHMIPTEITANYSGIVSTVNTVAGSLITPNQVIATISDLSSLQAKITVAEQYASSIAPGQKVSIYVDALDKEYSATVKSVAPVAHEQFLGVGTQTVINVSAIIDDIDEKLKAGYNVSGEIEIFAPKIVNTIPYTAINQDEGNNEYVYVYENARAVKRYIKTGVEFPEYVEVLDGITEDDIVILDNVQVAYENQVVKIN